MTDQLEIQATRFESGAAPNDVLELANVDGGVTVQVNTPELFETYSSSLSDDL